MEENSVTVNEKAIEQDIYKYKLKKNNETRRAWRKRKMEENPNYYRELHQRYKKSDSNYKKKRDGRQRKEFPKSLSDDMKEWMRRRCLTYKDVAERLGVSENYVRLQVQRSTKVSVRLLRYCGFDYNYSNPPKQYVRKYRKHKRDNKTICAECSNVGCSWMMDSVPVNDWDAEIATINRWKDNSINTFVVYACPQYTDSEYSCYTKPEDEEDDTDE